LPLAKTKDSLSSDALNIQTLKESFASLVQGNGGAPSDVLFDFQQVSPPAPHWIGTVFLLPATYWIGFGRLPPAPNWISLIVAWFCRPPPAPNWTTTLMTLLLTISSVIQQNFTQRKRIDVYNQSGTYNILWRVLFFFYYLVYGIILNTTTALPLSIWILCFDSRFILALWLSLLWLLLWLFFFGTTTFNIPALFMFRFSCSSKHGGVTGIYDWLSL
jgi:hypothetical protein